MSRFYVEVPIEATSVEEAEEALEKMSEGSLATLFFDRKSPVIEREPNFKVEVPWQAMAALCGLPYATEQELQDHFGCGRTTYCVSSGNGRYIVGLSIAKETRPIVCYVNYGWLG